MKFATSPLIVFLVMVTTVTVTSSSGCTTSNEGLNVQIPSDDDGVGAGGSFAPPDAGTGQGGGDSAQPMGGAGGDMATGGMGMAGTGGQAGTGGTNAGGSGQAGSGGNANMGGSGGSANMGGSGGSANMGGSGGMDEPGTFEREPTPQRIVCGDQTCTDGAFCCLSGDEPRCANGVGQCQPYVIRRCDERSDCDGPDICCADTYREDDVRSLCVRRETCAELRGTFVLCANSGQCWGERRVCCATEFDDITVGVCRADCR